MFVLGVHVWCWCLAVCRHALGYGHVTDGGIRTSVKNGQRAHVATVTLLVCKVFVGRVLDVGVGDAGRYLTRAPHGYDAVRQPYTLLADTCAYGVYAHTQAYVAYVVTVQLLAPCFVDGSCCQSES